MSIEERLEKISLDWFLVEPALFKVLCSHRLAAESGMQCPVRSGQRRVDYNPELCNKLSDAQLGEYLKAECIRILLKHPYERQPDDCDPIAISMGSNCVLGENYTFRAIKMEKPDMFGIAPERYFEAYAKDINRMIDKIKQMLQQAGIGDSGESNGSGQSEQSSQSNQSNGSEQNGKPNGSEEAKEPNDPEGPNRSGQSGDPGEKLSQKAQAMADASKLWQEDTMTSAEINEMIHQMEASNQWGSLSANLIGQIIASTRVKIDYRRVMQSFRAEVLSSKRRLTRMRPNRRSGFQNFGSVYRLSSRLLVAIDVSGSTTDKMVSDFFGIVNKFFKYGIEEIDVIQFDTEIKGEPVKMKKAAKSTIDITGRGGTSFQPVFDFAAEQKNYYQGLVIFTDGYADEPQPAGYFRTPVLWVLPSEDEYETHKAWMEKTGKACFIM